MTFTTSLTLKETVWHNLTWRELWDVMQKFILGRWPRSSQGIAVEAFSKRSTAEEPTGRLFSSTQQRVSIKGVSSCLDYSTTRHDHHIFLPSMGAPCPTYALHISIRWKASTANCKTLSTGLQTMHMEWNLALERPVRVNTSGNSKDLHERDTARDCEQFKYLGAIPSKDSKNIFKYDACAL